MKYLLIVIVIVLLVLITYSLTSNKILEDFGGHGGGGGGRGGGRGGGWHGGGRGRGGGGGGGRGHGHYGGHRGYYGGHGGYYGGGGGYGGYGFVDNSYYGNPWYYPEFLFGDYFSGFCKSGCGYLGNGTVGCTNPGYGPDSCIFASDCQGC